MEQRRLSELAAIRSGYPFRRRVEVNPVGKCRLIQMKDIGGAGELLEDEFARIEYPTNYESHQLEPGDVLIAGRGERNNAAAFLTDSFLAIAAANLIVLHPRSLVAPEYLTWFLNLPDTQDRMRSLRARSSVPFIPLTALETMEIALPSREIQSNIVAIHKLSLREETLTSQIQRKRRTLIDGLLAQAMRQNGPGGDANLTPSEGES